MNVQSQGIEFFEGDYKDAIAKAKSSDKLFFVDAYAVWCGPCKRMSKNIFPVEAVGDYFNANFISMKIDMEKGQGLEFRKKYPVSAFPTFFFINGDGEVVYNFKGGRDVNGFIAEAKKAVGKYDNSDKYAKLYEDGNREFETVYKYVKSLNREGESSLKIANEYFRAKKKLNAENDLKMLYEAFTEVDSKLYDLYVKEKPGIVKIYNQELYNEKLLSAAKNTFEKSIEFESASLEKMALTAVKKNLKPVYKSFQLQCELEKARRSRDAKLYVDNANKYHKQVILNKEPDEVKLINELMTLFSKNYEALELSSKIAVNVATNNLNTSNCLLACRTFIRLKDKINAKLWADKALVAAGDDRHEKLQVIQQLKILESI